MDSKLIWKDLGSSLTLTGSSFSYWILTSPKLRVRSILAGTIGWNKGGGFHSLKDKLVWKLKLFGNTLWGGIQEFINKSLEKNLAEWVQCLFKTLISC